MTTHQAFGKVVHSVERLPSVSPGNNVGMFGTALKPLCHPRINTSRKPLLPVISTLVEASLLQ